MYLCKMKYKIYYITSKKDNYSPIYVGVTVQSLSSRLCKHKSESKVGNSPMNNWVKSRLLLNEEINIELLDEVEETPFFWEDYYIYLMRYFGFTLKNMLLSNYSSKNVNNKGIMSKQAKDKLSKLYTGKVLSKDRVALSVQHRLNEASKRGYYHSPKTKLIMSIAAKNKVISEKELNRLRTCNIGRESEKRIPILGLNLKTQETIQFKFILEASNSLTIPHSNIIKVLTKKRNSAGGFYFCKLSATCPIKIPLNGETPEEDNPVLNQVEIFVNA